MAASAYPTFQVDWIMLGSKFPFNCPLIKTSPKIDTFSQRKANFQTNYGYLSLLLLKYWEICTRSKNYENVQLSIRSQSGKINAENSQISFHSLVHPLPVSSRKKTGFKIVRNSKLLFNPFTPMLTKRSNILTQVWSFLLQIFLTRHSNKD